MQNEKLKINMDSLSVQPAACSLKREKGIALLMILIMLSTLAGVVMICAFVLSHEVDKDERHEITRQRMLEVKRALIGRLADVGGGVGITSSGGFISDFGEPVDSTGNFIDRLLSEPDLAAGPDNWPDWLYDTGNQFWAGYRVWAANDGSYLIASPGEAEFRDGWGNIMQVRFNANQIEIESWGSDGIDDVATPPTNYDRDIIKRFYWRRNVTVNNTSANEITVRLIYPSKGTISIATGSVATGVSFTFAPRVPVGLRKLEVRDGLDVLQQTKVFSLPPGKNAYSITIN